MKPRDLAAYGFLALAWGLSFLVVIKIVEAFGWVGAVSFRAFVAGGTLLLAARASGRKLAFGGRWGALTFVGATTVAGQLIGLSYATPLIGTAMAAILVATIPLFSMLLGRLFGIEKLTNASLAGLVIGFFGIVILVGFPAVPVTSTFIIGCAGILFASFCAATGSVFASVRLRGVGPWEVTIGSFLTGGLMALPLIGLVPVPGVPRLIDYGYLIIAGAGMSALTYVLYFGLVASIGATRAISVEFAVTVVAVLVGGLILHEPLSAMQLVGAAIIVCGCALVLGLVGGGGRPPAQG